jgi:hypothetical protein
LREGTLQDLTPDTGEIQLHLAGELPSSELQTQLFAGLKVEHSVTETPSDPGYLLRLSADDEQLNALIDRMRRSNIPILQIRRERRTLEDVFIDLVQGGSQ